MFSGPWHINERNQMTVREMVMVMAMVKKIPKCLPPPPASQHSLLGQGQSPEERRARKWRKHSCNSWQGQGHQIPFLKR